MIAAYCGSSKMDTYSDADTYRNQVKDLLDNKMIILSLISPGYNYRITDKGKFWLEYVLNLPYPVSEQVWRIPT